MTHEEIDKWVEEHLDGIDKDTILNDLYIKVGQEIAHKFYELGKQSIAEDRKKEAELPRFYGD